MRCVVCGVWCVVCDVCVIVLQHSTTFYNLLQHKLTPSFFLPQAPLQGGRHRAGSYGYGGRCVTGLKVRKKEGGRRRVYGAVWCCVVLCGAVWCCVVLLLCGMILTLSFSLSLPLSLSLSLSLVVSPASRLKKRFHFRTVTGGADGGQQGGHVEEEDSNQNTEEDGVFISDAAVSKLAEDRAGSRRRPERRRRSERRRSERRRLQNSPAISPGAAVVVVPAHAIRTMIIAMPRSPSVRPASATRASATRASAGRVVAVAAPVPAVAVPVAVPVPVPVAVVAAAVAPVAKVNAQAVEGKKVQPPTLTVASTVEEEDVDQAIAAQEQLRAQARVQAARAEVQAQLNAQQQQQPQQVDAEEGVAGGGKGGKVRQLENARLAASSTISGTSLPPSTVRSMARQKKMLQRLHERLGLASDFNEGKSYTMSYTMSYRQY